MRAVKAFPTEDELAQESHEVITEYFMHKPDRIPDYTDEDFCLEKYGWLLAYKLAFLLQQHYITDETLH